MNATSNVYQYTTTFFMTSLVMSLKPDVTSKPISDSDKPSRKRKECSGSPSGLYNLVT